MKRKITSQNSLALTKLFITCLLLLNFLTASAQNNWTRQYPLPGQQLFDIAYGAGKYIAVGASSIIRTSTDGLNWTTQPTSLSEYGSLSSIIYVNGRFIAVGVGGVIVTSTDGVTWTKRNSGTTWNINSIAYGGNTYVAVGQLGVRLTSSDGINWTCKTEPSKAELNDVLYYKGMFVAVGEKGQGRWTVDNGVTWNSAATTTSETLMGVAVNKYGIFVAVGTRCAIVYSNTGKGWISKPGPAAVDNLWLRKVAANPKTGAFVAISNNQRISLFSNTGDNWQHAPVQTGTDQILYGLRYFQNAFIATGGQCILRATTDGLAWYSSTINYWQMFMKGVAYGNGRFVLVGDSPSDNGTSKSYANLAITTTDGVHFTAGETIHLPGGANCFNDVAFGNNTFVAVGADAIIQTSKDGISWSYGQVEFGKNLRSVAYGNNMFVAVGDNGLILYSSTGRSWIKSTSAAIYSYNKVAFANGLFILVGPKGVLATSTDGNFWMYRYASTKENLYGITFGNGKWVAVGSNNTMISSSNGLQWTLSHPGINTPHFTNIVYGNNEFVITGLNGDLFKYKENTAWGILNSQTNDNLVGIAYGNGLYMAVGSGGTITTSDLSPEKIYEDADPGCGICRTAQADSILAEEVAPEAAFNVVSYPNPVEDQFSVNVKGAAGEKVRMQLLDLSGRTILDKVVDAQNGEYVESVSMGQKQTGMYLLRVSTSSQTQTVKILKR